MRKVGRKRSFVPEGDGGIVHREDREGKGCAILYWM